MENMEYMSRENMTEQAPPAPLAPPEGPGHEAPKAPIAPPERPGGPDFPHEPPPERHHGPGGPHGPHGPHGPGCPPPPPPPPHIDWELYPYLNTEGKLLAMLRALGHASRSHPGGRGGQDRALRILPPEGPMTQRELTERLGIQPGSASELVGKLERAGLITRSPSEADRRTADVRLTEAGLARRQERAAAEREDTARSFEALTEEEKTTLLSLLEKLYAAWQAPERERPGPG